MHPPGSRGPSPCRRPHAAARRLHELYQSAINPTRVQIEKLTRELDEHRRLAAGLCALAGEYHDRYAAHDQPASAAEVGAGIAALAGWKPGNSVHVRARTDPDFPHAHSKIGRDYWYPFDGDHGVDAYLALLAERAQAKKPPALQLGDPDDLLNSQEAAEAMHIAWSTFRSYIRYSTPRWEGREPGRPLIPSPDSV